MAGRGGGRDLVASIVGPRGGRVDADAGGKAVARASEPAEAPARESGGAQGRNRGRVSEEALRRVAEDEDLSSGARVGMTTRVPEALAKRLQDVSAITGLSVSEIVADGAREHVAWLLAAHLEEQGRPVPRARTWKPPG